MTQLILKVERTFTNIEYDMKSFQTSLIKFLVRVSESLLLSNATILLIYDNNPWPSCSSSSRAKEYSERRGYFFKMIFFTLR